MNSSELKKRAAKPQAEAEGRAAPTNESADLDRIREILFGRQSQTFEARLNALDTTARDETKTLRTDTAKRLASLELYVKGEITALSERLRTEMDDRNRSIKQISREIREGLETIDKRLAAAAEQTEEELRLLREQVLHDSQSLRDELHASASPGAASAAGTLPH